MRFIYSSALYALLPFVFLRLFWRGFRARAYWCGWGQRLGYCRRVAAGSIWIHAVSVGEVQAATPVIDLLKQRYRNQQFVVTTITPTGAAQLRKVFGQQVIQTYLPYDLPAAVRRFLDRVNPSIAIIMETELWPNLFHACARRNIPVVLANARMSERSARAYGRFKTCVQDTLRQVAAIAAQSHADGQRLTALGVPSERVQVTGSVKFDFQIPAQLIAAAEPLRRDIGAQRRVWIAASTHENEETLLLPVLQSIKARVPHSLLIVVPRHPERFDHVANVFRRSGYQVVRRSDHVPCTEEIDVFVGDTMGELPMYYAVADVAVIGGSFVPVGGHNPLEAAVLGVPAIIGPHVFNFVEIVALLETAGALYRVRESSELTAVLSATLLDPARRKEMGRRARAVVEQNRGACEQLSAIITGLLEGPGAQAVNRDQPGDTRSG